ncbi:hypothetical protein ARMSODRAFT_439629 [Armillaria solidipes]|uniref:Uncharacterized protein n=1 Tax=Armillaria solidipes TaxID=1076256 RepID=A0A2H3B311_9AGAR|nr:hypothetical protein ARMSODRAFT_439629 [Armillaria solidipes]
MNCEHMKRRTRRCGEKCSWFINPNMPPQRVWDLYSNRVVPHWTISDKKPWAISYTLMDPEYHTQVNTPINAH